MIENGDEKPAALIPDGITAAAWTAIGAQPDGSGWLIPERCGEGKIIGWSRRFPDGSKGFMAGGKRGLTLAWPLPAYAGSSPTNPILIVEGASDTAAGITLDFDTVGRPSAAGGAAHLAELLAGRHVCLVGENDRAGRKGSETVAESLLPAVASLRLLYPPEGVKDLRAWLLAGLTHESLSAAIRSATPIPPATPTADGDPIIVRMSDVEPESVAWLWQNRIARGKITIISGDPKQGKSLLTVDMAARVSTGTPWPDAAHLPQEGGGVVLLSAEDGLADTIRPRLDAAGANLERINAIQAIRTTGRGGSEASRSFDLGRDLPSLLKAMRQVSPCRLVIIDPITAYLGGVDSHKNADIRGLLAPLAMLAAEHDVAVVAVSHLNKSAGGSAMYRTMGSLAFIAAARAAWAISKDPKDPTRRLFLPIGNNLAPDTGGLAYRVECTEPGHIPRVRWETGTVHITADEALAPPSDGERGRTERDDAADWLLSLLADGPVLCEDVKREATAAGHSWGTVRRAKAALSIASRKRGFDGPHEWCLPEARSEGEHHLKMRTEEMHLPDGAHLGTKLAEINGFHPKVRTDDGLSTFGAPLGVKLPPRSEPPSAGRT